MKKLIITFLCTVLTFIFPFCFGFSLKGGVSEDYISDGFYGSWGVISKMTSSNNPTMFNMESRDIWILSGSGNKLILENLESGAHSEIILKEKSKDGKLLTFDREKTIVKNGIKTTYKEKVSFILMGNNFSGTDSFEVLSYDEKGKLKSTDYAKYACAGVKISR